MSVITNNEANIRVLFERIEVRRDPNVDPTVDPTVDPATDTLDPTPVIFVARFAPLTPIAV